MLLESVAGTERASGGSWAFRCTCESCPKHNVEVGVFKIHNYVQI